MCDYFAGCLLVPKTLLRSLWADGTRDTKTLARTFAVSPAAMRVRLRQTGLTTTRRHGVFHRQAPTTGCNIGLGSKVRALEAA